MSDFSKHDIKWMRQALALAARGRGRVSPNPMVGALLVRDGAVVGRGWHRAFGGPHAEVEAIRRAGAAARGATMYVTLEPCAHTGKTPPCTEAVLAAGIAHVIVAARDTNPKVTGGGCAWLAARGVTSRTGLLEAESRELNRGFFRWVEQGRPWVTLKLAASLDGGIATANGASKWITGEAARVAAHALRAGHDAVVAGAATIMADDPALTVRLVKGANPARIVLDPTLKSKPRACWLADDGARRVIVALAAAPAARRRAFEAAGAEVWTVGADRRGGLNLKAFVTKAGAAGFLSLMVEGGGRLAGALLRDRLVDRLELFNAPILLGGTSRRWTAGLDIAAPARAPRLNNLRLSRLGDDWRVTGDF